MLIKNITSIIDVERISFERNSTAITGVMGRIDRAGYNPLTRIGWYSAQCGHYLHNGWTPTAHQIVGHQTECWQGLNQKWLLVF